MIFTKSGHLMLDAPSFLLSWLLVLEEEGGGGRREEIHIGPENMQCSWRTGGKGYIAHWKGGLERHFFVEIYWEKSFSGYKGRFQYGGLTGKYRIKKILFPLLYLPEDLREGKIFFPAGTGKMVEIASIKKNTVMEMDALSLPFTFLEKAPGGKNGVFLAALPEKGCFLKTFFENSGKGERVLALTHLVAETPTSRKKYALPYDCLFSPLREEGEAAGIFRQYRESTSLYKSRRRYKKSPFDLLWKWQSTSSLELLEKAAGILQEKKYSFALLSDGLLLPEEREFLLEKKIPLVLSCSGMRGEMGEEDEKRSLILDEKGEKTPNSLYCLAPETPGWRRIKEEAERVSAEGFYKGVLYKDLLSSEGNTPCFSHFHLHAPGGGSYRKEAILRLLKKIHKEDPSLLLYAEGGSWELAGVLDGMILPPLSENEGEIFADLFAGELPLYRKLFPCEEILQKYQELTQKRCRPFLGEEFCTQEALSFLRELPEKGKK